MAILPIHSLVLILLLYDVSYNLTSLTCSLIIMIRLSSSLSPFWILLISFMGPLILDHSLICFMCELIVVICWLIRVNVSSALIYLYVFSFVIEALWIRILIMLYLLFWAYLYIFTYILKIDKIKNINLSSTKKSKTITKNSSTIVQIKSESSV